MTLYEELCKAFKIKRNGEESFDDFAARAVKKVNAADDTVWNALTQPLQVWNNATQMAMEKSQSLPKLAGWPGADEDSDNGEAVDDDATTGDDGDGDGDAEGTEAGDEPAAEGDTVEEETVDGDDSQVQEESSDDTTQSDDAPTETEPRGRRGAPKKADKAKPATKTAKAELKTGKAKNMATKTAPKTAAKKAAVPKKAAATAPKNNGGGGERIKDDQKIKLVTAENPHRAGTILHTYFKKYKDGMTVAAAVKAGVPLSNIRYLRGCGHIKVT